MKLSNFQYLLEGKGLSNYSQKSKEICEKYKNTPQIELKKIVENYLKEKIK
ncbi:hypothetical protein [Lebetimonas natsushimae]|nr:hypothetical protein [Lebetimonas natsushimae]